MFYGKLSEVTPQTKEIVKYPDTVIRAFKWLKENDYSRLPLGKTAIEGERIFVSVAEYQTKPGEEVILEAHRKYVDIQLVIFGEELMGWVPCSPDLPVLDDGYDEEKDVVFFPKEVMPFWSAKEESSQKILVKAGEFCVFAPEDVHASQIFDNEPVKTRKIVVKCRV
ncbi:MAG: DUF386 domain-containing protein [Planctomycetaceae bacterium]|nr:DUF386 domain-containing protein [Planctomycetaceae bacterium]MDO4424652.1 YhcH/YjgK/YiaL family protein [Planctomycetia bacterium]